MSGTRNALLAGLTGLLLSFPLLADTVIVQGMRAWQAPDNTRVVFDLSASARYKTFRMHNPERLVIDVMGGSLAKRNAMRVSAEDRVLKKVRTGYHKNKKLRMVLDLHQPVSYKTFQLKPYNQYGHRLVVDLYPKQPAGRTVAAEKATPAVIEKKPQSTEKQVPASTVSTRAVADTGGTSANSAAKSRTEAVKKTRPVKKAPVAGGMRDLVIAIDAGHGGEDPGAIGYRGSYEKHAVMGIAKELAALVEKERGMKPLLIRKGDYFLSLRKRTQIARDNRADLFVSIHADAFKDRRVSGTSVYVLSQNGATDEAARFLADKENASDLIGGVSLEDKDEVLASVLLDLSQTATLESSLEAADFVLGSLRGMGRTHKSTVQQAGFAVLKSPDIPSMLIETAFISNPVDERRLKSKAHQRKVAKSILAGVRGYFAKNAPEGTLFAARRHIIARGDTLSGIASRYKVSVASIKNVNSLRGDTVRVGQVLHIPSGREG